MSYSSFAVTFSTHINDAPQQTLLQHQLENLSESDKETLTNISNLNLTQVIDGRGLACPMPLLKTKMALKSMPTGSSVYILATDPNSSVDLAAFAKQSGLEIPLNTQTTQSSDNDSQSTTHTNGSERLDTIFHVIITKTHGN